MIAGKVQAIDEHEAKSGKTYWKVKVKGVEYTTFDYENIDGLEVGMSVQADVAEKKDGKFTNRYWNSWEATGEPAEGPATHSNGKAATAPPTTGEWEAKDRRIAMEAAYGSAARFMNALAYAAKPADVTALNFRALARTIYHDVIAAGKGSEFKAPAPGAGKTPTPAADDPFTEPFEETL